MRMKGNTKIAVLLLSLIVMLGFANCAMANNFRHHNLRSNGVFGITINLGELSNRQNYYNPYQTRYSYYANKRALRNYYRAKRELARYESYNYPNRRYVEYYRY